MVIQCNAGSKTNMVGDLPRYLGEVWYYLSGIANILSLANVKRFYWVTYDSRDGGRFCVHKNNGTIREFVESPTGLYYMDAKSQSLSGPIRTLIPTSDPTGDPLPTVSDTPEDSITPSLPPGGPTEISLLTPGSIVTVAGQQAKYPQRLLDRACQRFSGSPFSEPSQAPSAPHALEHCG